MPGRFAPGPNLARATGVQLLQIASCQRSVMTSGVARKLRASIQRGDPVSPDWFLEAVTIAAERQAGLDEVIWEAVREILAGLPSAPPVGAVRAPSATNPSAVNHRCCCSSGASPQPSSPRPRLPLCSPGAGGAVGRDAVAVAGRRWLGRPPCLSGAKRGAEAAFGAARADSGHEKGQRERTTLVALARRVRAQPRPLAVPASPMPRLRVRVPDTEGPEERSLASATTSSTLLAPLRKASSVARRR